MAAASLLAAMLAAMVCARAQTPATTTTNPFADAEAAYARGDYATALQLNLSLADEGNAIAQFNVGLMHDNGHGVPRDQAEAAKWYRKAADQGLAPAQFNLGVGYEKGKGLQQDYAEAAKWFRKAADQDFAMAEYSLGVLYAQGKGVPRDYVEAHKWFSLAASPYLAADNNVRALAAKGRGMVAARMTPDQIAEAQRLVREWKPLVPSASAK